MSKPGYVYIMTNQRYGTLYIGVTSDLTKHAYEHRTGAAPGNTKRHGLKQFVYYEAHDDIEAAIAREKATKEWQRSWKLNRIPAAMGQLPGCRRRLGPRQPPPERRFSRNTQSWAASASSVDTAIITISGI